MLPVALACQDTATIQKVLTETMQLYEDHDRDAGDTIMMAYEKGTFTKVTALLAAALAPALALARAFALALALALLHQGHLGSKPS